MTGSVVQVNISRGGVPKRAIVEGVVTPLGIQGDVQAHPGIHGGPLQALLVISSEGIDDLTTLGFPLFYGALGENITTRDLDRRFWRIGQRWRVGMTVIEFTKVRAPCSQLDVYGQGIERAVYDAAIQAGDPLSPRWGLSGFYASVVQPGVIRAGDPIVLLDHLA
jgi:MOSC domain-containing protein YiiM